MTEPNPQQFIKTPQQVKEQIERWYLKYHNVDLDLVDPMGVFTLFDKLPSLKKEIITQKLTLSANELAVLVLHVKDDNFIVNTTHRFINVNGGSITSIVYTEFECHTGYRSISAKTKEGAKHVKTNGYLHDFGIKCTNGEVVYWFIPTGSPGFAFWNVTNKFDIIGRKYIISEL